jgi:hypothetical protein
MFSAQSKTNLEEPISGLSLSKFFALKNKSELKEKIKTWKMTNKISGLNVKNMSFVFFGRSMTKENDPKIKTFGIKIEFSGPNTLMVTKILIEKFIIFIKKIRLTLNGAGF